ncbi:ABC transporter permease [Chloroflexota bacterium]
MNKTILIMKHEFGRTIRRRGFIIMTLLFPMIALIAIGILQIVQGIDTSGDLADAVTIGYVDELGRFDHFTTQSGEITLSAYNTQEEATSALLAKDISEYFIIPLDYITTGLVTRYTLEKELEPAGETQWAMRSFLLSNLLEGQTSPEIAERVKSSMYLSNIRLDESGEVAADQGGVGGFIVPSLFGLLLIMAIFSSSGYLLQGLGEEKENRIMEILLSSVSARQLLTGKVLGLGAVGLVQIIFWLLSAVFMVRLASTTIGGVFSMIQIPSNMLLLGIVYFILGYLFFAVLMAGIGAIGATARESQQLSALVIVPAIIPLYVFLFIMRDNPDHVIGTIFTMIPFSAPIMVFMRLGVSEIPPWELALSISLLIAGIIGGLALSAKVFRVFLLMYGKTPKVGEIIRSLRKA